MSGFTQLLKDSYIEAHSHAAFILSATLNSVELRPNLALCSASSCDAMLALCGDESILQQFLDVM